MTDQSSPITPPPQLVQQWFKQAHESADPANQLSYYDFIATSAAQWGWDKRGAINEAMLQERADQELDACCEWFAQEGYTPNTPTRLRAARRPKPPSRKKQALLQLDTLNADLVMHGRGCDLSQIRGALEALPND